MFTTATVDTNKGRTFAAHSCTSKFPTTTPADNEQAKPNNDWDLATQATTTDGWNIPLAPSPPLSAVGQHRANNHVSLHWTACYDDYCGVHRQMKDDNYYPQRGNDRRRHNQRPCSCPHAHPFELAEVIRNQHLNPHKACADWQKGKRVCPDCRFLVNMENHHLRCSASAPRNPLADITTPQKDQENIAPPGEVAANDEAHAATPAALRDEQISLLHDIVTMLHHTTTRDARCNHVVYRTLAQRMNEFHDADQQQLQQMANNLGAIITKQQRMNEQLQARQHGSPAVRIYHTPIHRRAAPARHDLAGASVWTGDVCRRTILGVVNTTPRVASMAASIASRVCGT